MLFFLREIKDLSNLQASVSGRKGILPEMSRALHLESGIVDKCRLPAGDDRAPFPADFVLAVLLFRSFYAIEVWYQVSKKYEHNFVRPSKICNSSDSLFGLIKKT